MPELWARDLAGVAAGPVVALLTAFAVGRRARGDRGGVVTGVDVG